MLRLASRRVAQSDAPYICLSCHIGRTSSPIQHFLRHQTTALPVKEAAEKKDVIKGSKPKKKSSLLSNTKDRSTSPSKPAKPRRRRLTRPSSSKGSKKSAASREGRKDPDKVGGNKGNVVRKISSKKETPPNPSKDVAVRLVQFKSKPTKIDEPNWGVQVVHAAALDIRPIEVEQPSVPTLSYGLERVLFNPGVYHLQDPRSRVYNFDPYLQKIMPVAEFDFNALKQYITSSRDESLQGIARKYGKKYVGSTSSMTGVLAHFHYLLSQWRGINASTLSQGFPDKLRSFTQLQRCPAAIFLRKKEGCYAIDADKQFDSASILSMLGKSMEKFLTLSPKDYERYRKSNPDSVSEEERNSPEAFHYSTMGDFLMRSQLDAHDSRLPGTGMFDLKTRAIVSVRMDAKNHEQGKDYEIRTRHGEWESFEREYFDMIRSAFLKYSLQVRMGRMDGIFVAFHNTERIFGFQYISLPEMDSTIHGQWETSLGDQEFKLSLELLNKCLDRASQRFPDTSLRIHVDTRETQTPFMYVFAEPVSEEQVQQIQTSNRESITTFERSVLGLRSETNTVDTGPVDEESAKKEWAELQAKVVQELENDEMSPQDNETMQNIETAFQRESIADTGTTPKTNKFDDAVPFSHESNDVDGKGQWLVSNAEGAPTHDFVLNNSKDLGATSDKEKEKHGEASQCQSGNVGKPREELHNLEAQGAQKDNRLQETHSDALENASEVEEEGKLLLDAGGSHTAGDIEFLDIIDDEQASVVPKGSSGSLLAMTVTIRNKVNGKYILRPSKLEADDKWSVEYSIAEVPSNSRAWSLYGACQARRKAKLELADNTEDDVAASYYLRKMKELSEKGKEWRKVQDEIDGQSEKVVLGQSSPNSIVRKSQRTEQ